MIRSLFLSLLLASAAVAQTLPAPPRPAKPVGPDTYESAYLRVGAGETVLMAFGVAAPDGCTIISPADAKRWGVPSGLWRCWKDGSGEKMMVAVRVTRPWVPVPLGGQYCPPGQI